MKIRSMLIAASCVGLFASTPVLAQMSMECTQATMTKANADVAKMTDATKRAAAMKEMEMAQKTFDTKDAKACVGHMNSVMTMMK